MDNLEPLQTEQTPTTEQEPTVTQQDKSAKVFTQSELNGVVQTRLSKAEAGFNKERAAWDTERTTYTSELETLQAVVKDAVINVVTAKMSATEKRLFEALPFEKQLEQVKDPEFLASLNQKVTTPETPEASKAPKTLFRRTSTI